MTSEIGSVLTGSTGGTGGALRLNMVAFACGAGI